MTTVTRRTRTLVAFAIALTILAARVAHAHEIVIKGVVVAVDRQRLEVKGSEDNKPEATAWYGIDAKTKFMRGKETVGRDQAKIVVGERVVVLVDHEASGTMIALEVRLAAR
jgi:hypothetical protein